MSSMISWWGSVEGAAVLSNPVTIGNKLPQISGVTLSPSYGSLCDTYTCSIDGVVDPDVLELASPERDVEVSRHGGYTAVGHYALPGERFTVELVDGGGLEVSLLINTQRTGSTREFNDGQYDRPKFLQSPALPLYEGEEVTLSTPFGGTLQLAVSESESDGAVRLRLGSVGSHAVLDQGADPLDYLADLETTLYPFTELRNPYVQIHSRADMMLESIDSYDGDLEAFFFDLDHYMILDTYNLAGFAGQELELNASVEAFCSELDWDCSSEALHGRPKLQHINVDAYAHCGGGCSGNPYDQAWALGPLGWGETHEIGHNLQRGRLSIYGGRSSEVSNQIFPLHKHWSFRADGGESLSADRPSYLATFEILQSAASSADPAGETYEAIWSAEGIYDNNGERMVFYMQVVHGSDDVPWLESGWDVYTLMYLHERLFTDALLGDWASQRDGLGFGTYSAAPDGMEANDFMLISMSFITGRDQRPFFELWGIDFTEAAGAQVASYGFEPVPRQFFASVDANAPPHPEPVPIDGVSLWPL